MGLGAFWATPEVSCAYSNLQSGLLIALDVLRPAQSVVIAVSVCPTGWTLMLALTGIPAVIELVFLPFFPESPRYMLIQKGDEEKARKGKLQNQFLNPSTVISIGF